MAPKTKHRRSRQVDITPSVDELLSKRNSEMTAVQCFAEFFDNAIDAGARHVHASIDSDRKVASVSDDGNGMLSAAAALVSGRHVRSGDRHGSSRYGVGMKDAGWRLGSCLTVDSVKDGFRTRSVADCESIMRRQKWVVTERSGKVSDKPNGTKITVTKFDFQWSSNAASLLRTGLEKLYADALRAGITMTVNGVELVAPPEPRLRVERTAELEVDGKRFRVRGGILASGQDAVSNGVTIRLPYRVICWGERAGFDGYDVSDFWAEVVLIEEKDDRSTWFRVTDHKNSLHEKTAICRIVAKLFEDVLKPQSSSHVITIPLPRSPKKDDDGLIIDDNGNAQVNDEPRDVGPQHEDEGGGGGPGGQPPGVAETAENGSKRAAPKKKRGYDLKIRMSPAKIETVAECRVGDKSATVVLGQQGNVFRGYTPGRDNGSLRDAVALFAVASGLVLRHEDDPKTPLDFLIDGSDKPMDRVLRTYDNLLTQWKPLKK
jgi:hypothetical protein